MIWKDIKGYGNYQVSDAGVIRNKRSGRELKPFTDRLQEYDRVTIYDGEGRRRKVLVHVIVADAFLPGRPPGMAQIDHINTNIHDNRAENLCYVTEEQNHANPITQFNREVARIRKAILSGGKSADEILSLIKAMRSI